MKYPACHFLKEQTADLHQQASNTDFMKRLITGHLRLQEYVTYLRGLAIIYTVLETQLKRSTNQFVFAVWKEEMCKLPLLSQDIADLQGDNWADQLTPIRSALRSAELIRVISPASQWQLFGCLYVLEGSTNGSSLIYPRLQNAFNLREQTGTRYLRNYQDKQSKVWRAFKKRMDKTLYSTQPRP